MIEEKIDQVDDLYLYEILKNPVLCMEFINNYDRVETEEEFEFHDYQKDWLCDFSSYMSICCSRSVGKTVFIVNLYIWMMVYKLFPEEYIIYGVPSEVHLQPVWAGLITQFRNNKFLKQFIGKKTGINSAEHTITLLNTSVLICRIAGQSGTGSSFIGIHEPVITFDESGYFPWQAFIEAQPSLNRWMPGHKMIVSGVPDGRREKSVCYYADQENSVYSKHRINSLQNPRFTEKDRRDAEEQYGGVDSEDYQHLVLGLHGRPVFALFDRGLMSISDNPVYKMLDIDGTKLQENLSEYLNRLATFPRTDKNCPVLFGIDLGFTDPTAIVINYIDKNRIYFHGRIQMTKVSWPIQEKIIDYLDTKFNPVIIGIDNGSAGRSTVHHLLQDSEYAQKNYAKRLIPIDFSSQVVLGVDNDGQEIKVKTKPFSVQILQDYANNHKLVFSSTDYEFITELERMTYSKTPSGEIVYKTLTQRGGTRGADHFSSAILCEVLAYYLEKEFIQSKHEKIKLFRPTWL